MKKISLLLIGLLVMSLFGNKMVAQTAIERLKADYPAIMEHYAKQLENQHADYIIAIDVSGTMNKHQNIVLPALNSFLNALPDGDYVSIIKFGTKAEEFGLSGVINQSTRGSFQNTLSRVYDRDPAFSQRTDLGAMCNAVLAQMDRPGANNLQYVFMFTDFINEPGVGNTDWKTLQERVAALSKINIIRAMAMQLPGANTGRDIQLVRNVYPNLQTINVDNSAQLNDWFEGQKAEITKVRLKDLILGDFDKWYSENKIKTELSIGLNRELTLDFEVDGDAVPAFVNGFMLTQCETVSRSNNVENIVLKCDTVYKGRAVTAEIGSVKFFQTSLCERNTKVTTLVTIRPTFTTGEKEGDASFANEIRNLGLENDLARTTELTAESDFVLGVDLWIACLLALVLIVLFVFFVKDTILPYRLNKLRVCVAEPSGEETRFEFLGETSKEFGKQGVIIDQADFVVRIYGRRGYPLIWPRAIILQIVEKPQGLPCTLDVNDKVCSGSSVKMKLGQDVIMHVSALRYTFTIDRV